MQLDSLSVAAMTAVMVNVSGVLFLVEMILRNEERVGRIWALSFLAGMLTTICYLIWSFDPAAIWPAAVGNGALVASAGFMWIGCRAYNDRAQAPSVVLVLLGSCAVYETTVIDAASGDWAGALPMFIAIALFTGLGGAEALRGEMGRHRNATALAVVLMLVCVYYAARTIVFVTAGHDAEVFARWFGTTITSIVTVVLTLVALLTTSVLRAERARVHGVTATMELRRTEDGVQLAETFLITFDELIERATARGERVGAVSVRVDDLHQIATAFGVVEADAVAIAWRAATRDAAPAQAQIGEDGQGGLVIAIVPESAAEAHSIAVEIRDVVTAAVREAGVSVIPAVTVGSAVASTSDARAIDLIEAAREVASETSGIEVREIAQ